MKRKPRTHIWVKTAQQLSKVQIDTILYCCTDHRITTICRQGESPVESTESLSRIEKKLPAQNFFRCHQSYLVNLDQVNHFREKSLEALFDEEMSVPVARKRKDTFLSRLL